MIHLLIAVVSFLLLGLILWLSGGMLVGPCDDAETRYRKGLRRVWRKRIRSRRALRKLLEDGFFGTEPEEGDDTDPEEGDETDPERTPGPPVPQPTGKWRRFWRAATTGVRWTTSQVVRAALALRAPKLVERTFAAAFGRFLSAFLTAVFGIGAAAAEGALLLATFPEYLPQNTPEWMERPGIVIAAATLASCVAWGGILLEALGVVRARVFRGRGMTLFALGMIGLALTIALDAAHVRGLVEAINARTVDTSAGLHQLAELKLGLFMKLSVLVFATAPIGVAAALEWCTMTGSLCVFAIGSLSAGMQLHMRRAGAAISYAPIGALRIVLRLGRWTARTEEAAGGDSTSRVADDPMPDDHSAKRPPRAGRFMRHAGPAIRYWMNTARRARKAGSVTRSSPSPDGNEP